MAPGTGSLQSKVIFGGETDEAGNLVLNNNDDNPILGELAMKTVRGETSASQWVISVM